MSNPPANCSNKTSTPIYMATSAQPAVRWMHGFNQPTLLLSHSAALCQCSKQPPFASLMLIRLACTTKSHMWCIKGYTQASTLSPGDCTA
jgi:hypothetical protein